MGFAVSQPQATVKLTAVPAVGQAGTETNSECPKLYKVLMSQAQVNSRQSVVPRGLIGTRCTTQVDIAGMTCDCLLDMGSQVTNITVFLQQKSL